MLDWIHALLDNLPPINGRRSPNLAALLGFVLGGLALGLYFLSFIDFLIPVGISIVATLLATKLGGLDGYVGLLAGALIAAFWGYFRAANSNKRQPTEEAAVA